MGIVHDLNMRAAFLFVALWLILAFWIAGWGRHYFLASIVLQLLCIGGVKYVLLRGGILDIQNSWPLLLFIVGLILEIIQHFHADDEP